MNKGSTGLYRCEPVFGLLRIAFDLFDFISNFF